MHLIKDKFPLVLLKLVFLLIKYIFYIFVILELKILFFLHLDFLNNVLHLQ